MCLFDIVLCSIIHLLVLFVGKKLNDTALVHKRLIQHNLKQLHLASMAIKYQDTSEEVEIAYDSQIEDFIQSHNKSQSLAILEDVQQTIKLAEAEMDTEANSHTIQVLGVMPTYCYMLGLLLLFTGISMMAFLKYMKII